MIGISTFLYRRFKILSLKAKIRNYLDPYDISFHFNIDMYPGPKQEDQFEQIIRSNQVKKEKTDSWNNYKAGS